MIKNFLKLAIRNLLKNKFLSFLNIFCLAVGIASLLIIGYYINSELSYDKHINDYDMIYRAEASVYNPERPNLGLTFMPGAFGPTMKDECPEINEYARIYYIESQLISYKEEKELSDVHMVDNSFLKMFDCRFLKGDRENALTEPNTIVLTESIAYKYFGKEEPMGKSLTIGNRMYKVTGICADPPLNTHFKYKYLLWHDGRRSGWESRHCYTYFKLNHGSIDLTALGDKFKTISAKYIRYLQGKTTKFELRPITKIHLHCPTRNSSSRQLEKNGDIKLLRFVFLVAIFILIITLVNSINLTTSKSVERAKEVGVKKVVGGLKSQLTGQFLAEFLLIYFVAMAIAIVIFMVSPTFMKHVFVNYHFSALEALQEAWLWGLMLLLFVIMVTITGLYPALVLSSHKPLSVLNGKFKSSAKGILIRKTLIGVQYVLAIAIIAGIVINKKQLTYMLSKDLGFKPDQVLVIKGPKSVNQSNYSSSISFLKTELLQNKNVNGVSLSSEVPGKGTRWNLGMYRLDMPDVGSGFGNIGCDDSYLDVYDMKLLAGRNFRVNDRNVIIIPETVAKKLLFESPGEAVNEVVNCPTFSEDLTIVGVIEDFHQRSLNTEIIDVGLVFWNYPRMFLSIKLNTADAKETVSNIKTIWNKTFPNDAFDYFFMDDFYNQQYIENIRFSNLITFFSIVLILIISMGLWGISSYSISLRTKELGVRRVLSAGSRDIASLLFNEFFVLILIASLISMPIAYYVFDNWLNNFAYRVSIGVWFFVLPVLLITIITIVSIGRAIIKAITTKPVDALKCE